MRRKIIGLIASRLPWFIKMVRINGTRQSAKLRGTYQNHAGGELRNFLIKAQFEEWYKIK